MTTPTENLLDWLRDAHAMEQQAEKMLRAQAERLEKPRASRTDRSTYLGDGGTTTPTG